MYRRLDTASRVFRDRGARGVISVLRQKAHETTSGLISVLREKAHNAKWVGRLIELTCNRVRIDGQVFSLDTPAVSTSLKGQFLFGCYEEAERRALTQILDPALPVVELGGSIGVVACATNRRLRTPERHVVVEANPDLIPTLTRNRDWNGCRFRVVNRALAYGGMSAEFIQDSNFLASRVGGGGARSVEVPAITLRQLVDQHAFETVNLICDIEGAEGELVAREGDVLATRVRTLILETHDWALGGDGVRDLLHRIRALGFRQVFQESATSGFLKD